MKFKSLIMSLILVFSLNIYAGPSVGGGGDVIILPDDSVVLADPWIDSGAPQPNNMPPLRALSPRILQSLSSYALAAKSLLLTLGSNSKSDIANLLSELSTRQNNLRFYGVQTAEELNNYCAPGGKKIYKLPTGASIQQVACTAGSETFIVEPLFIKLTLRDQSLLLIHERLTTLRDKFGGKNYSAVARFTSGFGLFLNLYNEQALKKYRNLTEAEVALLTDFYISIEELEKRDSDVDENSFQWKAHQFGGGAIHLNSSVDPTALIGLKTFVPKNSVINSGAKIINFVSDLRVAIEMGKNSQLINTSLNYDSYQSPSPNAILKLNDNAQVTGSKLVNLDSTFDFGENNVISNTVIKSLNFLSGPNSNLLNSEILTEELELGSHVEFNSSKLFFENTKIKVASLEKLINNTADAETSKSYFPLGVALKPIVFTTTVTQPTKCTYLFKRSDDETIDYKLNYLKNVGLEIKGKVIQKSHNIFKKEYVYSFEDIVINANIKTFETASSNSSLVLDDKGHFSLPGYSKKPIQFNMSNLDLCRDTRMKIASIIISASSVKTDYDKYDSYYVTFYPEAL